MAAAPEGTVTLLFTDIEGSTRLLRQTGEGYVDLLLTHRRLLREAFQEQGGYEVATEGDAFFVAFASAKQAVAAAATAQHVLAAHDWSEGQRIWVRMGLHTGEPRLLDGNYVGLDVHHAARVMAAGHGGQVLLSQSTRDLLGDDANLRDLGVHRLKDLSLPQRLYQLQIEGLPSEFPALRTLENRPTNLPVQPTPLIGRENELEEVAALLLRSEVRLVTLTGPGGTGKTRLALQTAANLIEEYPDGVYFVSLATVHDPELFVPTVAQTLGVREQPDEALLVTLGNFLVEKSMLLLLDNLEQIPRAAGGISRLLASASGLTVLATSREPLNAAGEWLRLVPPLGVPDLAHRPDPKAIGQYESVRLFSLRAEAVRQDFSLTDQNAQSVAEICIRLDGLPLALELAAARIRVLSPQAILARLDQRLKLLIGGSQDLDQRQQTLKATIDWSYDLLSPEEQLLFARMAVFVGGCRLDAAENVCNPHGDLVIEVFDGIASLVQKSLLRQRDDPDGEPRFWMLETIREYGVERLRQDHALEDTQRRHALFYSNAVEDERTGNPLSVLGREGDLPAALGRVEQELANIRDALEWLREHQPARVASIIEPLNHYWIIRGSVAEAEPWLDFALAQEELAGTLIRASLLRHRGAFLATKGEFDEAASAFHESVSECRRLGDDVGISGGLVSLATIAVWSDDVSLATRLLDEARAAAERAGEETTLAHVLVLTAEVEQSRGNSETSAALLREARDLCEKTGEAEGVAECNESLAVIAIEASLFDEAEALLASSLSIVRKLRHVVLLARCAISYAAIAHSRNEDARAVQLLVAADQLLTFANAPPPPAERRLQERTAAAVRTELDRELDARRGLDQQINFDAIVTLARPDLRS